VTFVFYKGDKKSILSDYNYNTMVLVKTSAKTGNFRVKNR